VVDGIVNRMPVRWIIHRRHAKITGIRIISGSIVNCCIVCGSVVISKGEVNSGLKIPFVVRIKIKMTRVIIPVDINMVVCHYIIFIKFLIGWFTLITILFLYWFYPRYS
jgi:hypothetical protein